MDGLSEKIKKIVSTPIIKILALLIVIAIVLLIALLIIGPESTKKFTGLSSEAKEQLKKEIDETQDRFPIAKILPYGGAFSKKTYFIHAPRKDGTILVEYDKGQDETKIKEEVYNWVKYNGYNPSDYSLVFKVKEFERPK